jgi:hypothetical protein
MMATTKGVRGMRRQDLINSIRRYETELRSLGVASLAVFGSVGRDEAGAESDVDLLVEFDRPIGLFQFYRVQEYLEGLLGTGRVDLVLRKAVVDELKDVIYEEAVPCFTNAGDSASNISWTR